MKKIFCTPLLRALSLLLGMILLFAAGGCDLAPVQDDGVGGRYLALWADGSYAGMYALTTPKVRETMEEEAFVKRYTDIYAGMGITKIEIIEQSTQAGDKPSHRKLPFTLICHTKMAGELHFEMELPLVYSAEEKVWKVDWSESLIFPGMVAGDTVRVTAQMPTRGEIFSSDSVLLAKNGYAVSVCVSLSDAERMDEADDDLKGKASRLAALLDLPAQDIEKKLLSDTAKRNGSAVITSYPPKDLSYDGREGLGDELRAQLLEIPGVFIDEKSFTPVRYYPFRESLSHVIGYTSPVTKEDVQKGAAVAGMDRIGKAGLEAAYEELLRGTPGYEVAIYSELGVKKEVLFQRKAQNGVDLTLSIDMGMQRYAEALMKTYLLEDQTGVAIVMDPETGMIQALATEPSFDLNLFLYPILEDVWKGLNDPENGQPLFSRAMQGLYPAGSIIKPFTAAMALEAGAITPDYTFTGEIVKNRWKPNRANWYYPAISRAHGYDGPVNLSNALTESDNIYFADISLKTGREAMEAYFKEKLGLSERMPFDLSLGRAQLSKDGTLEDQKLLADTGYGQGEMLFSPVQLATTFASLANGGNILRPHIVAHTDIMEGEKYVRVQTTQPEIWKSGVVSQSSLNTLLPIMERVVTSGTGWRAKVEGMTIYGKTGTAEIGSDKSREIGWFAAFTRGEDARMVLVMIDGKTRQAGARIDIARELFKYGTSLQTVKPPVPTDDPMPDAPAPTPSVTATPSPQQDTRPTPTPSAAPSRTPTPTQGNASPEPTPSPAPTPSPPPATQTPVPDVPEDDGEIPASGALPTRNAARA